MKFLSEDPIGLSADVNQYRYTGNNPLIRKDPYGEDWRWLVLGGALIAIWTVHDLTDPNSEIIGAYEAAKKGCEDAKKKIIKFKDDSKKKWDKFWEKKKEPEFKPDPTSNPTYSDPNQQPPNRHVM